jgi:hypothetical protein
MDWMIGVQSLAGAGGFCPHPYIQTGSEAYLASCQLGTGGSFLSVNQLEHKADHSPPSSAKVKKAWG